MRAGERLRRLGRRSVTIPLYFVCFALALALLGPGLVLAGAWDLARREPFPRARCVAFLTFHLGCESAGILAAGACWAIDVAQRAAGRLDPAASQARLYALQWRWATLLYRGTERIFGLRTRVENDEAGRTGPLLVFCRHVSIGDALLPAVFLSARHGLRLRTVMKRELLLDPCLDLVGNRLPNRFVRRGAGEGAREAAALAALAEGLGPRDGLLLYPEGSRFTRAKHARAVERLEAAGEPALAAEARALRHVLPPRLGGALALLERAPRADVLFCAHTGLEDAATFRDLWRGSLVGAQVHVAFWRVAAGEIPRERPAAARWLFAQWRRVDDWIGRELAAA